VKRSIERSGRFGVNSALEVDEDWHFLHLDAQAFCWNGKRDSTLPVG